MGFENYGDVAEGQVSKINEAWLKMKRLDKLQDTMNLCEINPFGINFDADGRYNFEVKISCCDCLVHEIWGRITAEQRKDVRSLRKAIRTFLEKNPIIKSSTNKLNNDEKKNIDKKIWSVLEEQISSYEDKIRELLTKTGFDSMNRDEFDIDEL